MARPARVDFSGAWHHVINRGATQARIFFEDADCVSFLDELAGVVRLLGWEVHAWALLPNHFHLLVRSMDGNLASCMQRLSGRFTQARNRRTGRDGPVFRGRYRSELIRDERMLKYVVAYIHLKPVRAHLVQRPDEECWTSHRAHVGLDTAPDWMSRGVVVDHAGGAARLGDLVVDLQRKRHPWPEEMDLETGLLYAGRRGRRSSDSAGDLPLASPSAVLARVCRLTGATEADLRRVTRGRGANPARRFAVWMLARHTNLTHTAIAGLLGGTRGSVALLLHRLRQEVPEELVAWRAAWDEGSEKR